MGRLIDADELKKKINIAFLSEIGKIIDDAPTIDARPKGEWIELPFIAGINNRLHECSVCGNRCAWITLYCPFCGADMRGE